VDHPARRSGALSRDGANKVYVQDRIREQAREFVEWLEAGAHVYVCGDAKRMAPDVDRAIQEVAAAQLELSAEQAAEYVKHLRRDGRYLKDVY
jgi:sulfite reductase alpha subunit-like flavoprotein